MEERVLSRLFSSFVLSLLLQYLSGAFSNRCKLSFFRRIAELNTYFLQRKYENQSLIKKSVMAFWWANGSFCAIFSNNFHSSLLPFYLSFGNIGICSSFPPSKGRRTDCHFINVAQQMFIKRLSWNSRCAHCIRRKSFPSCSFAARKRRLIVSSDCELANSFVVAGATAFRGGRSSMCMTVIRKDNQHEDPLAYHHLMLSSDAIQRYNLIPMINRAGR